MSDTPFMPAPVPLMTAEKARDLARTYKAFADHVAESGLALEAARAERQSQWWLTYSIALAQTPR